MQANVGKPASGIRYCSYYPGTSRATARQLLGGSRIDGGIGCIAAGTMHEQSSLRNVVSKIVDVDDLTAAVPFDIGCGGASSAELLQPRLELVELE
jgi:hypothetical protein